VGIHSFLGTADSAKTLFPLNKTMPHNYGSWCIVFIGDVPYPEVKNSAFSATLFCLRSRKLQILPTTIVYNNHIVSMHYSYGHYGNGILICNAPSELKQFVEKFECPVLSCVLLLQFCPVKAIDPDADWTGAQLPGDLL
jgi:hypothetical protein